MLTHNPISHWSFYLGVVGLSQLANFLYGTHLTDIYTGYKVIRKLTLASLNLESKGFNFCPEVTAKIARQKQLILEVSISYHPRPIAEKKIQWIDGIKGLAIGVIGILILIIVRGGLAGLIIGALGILLVIALWFISERHKSISRLYKNDSKPQVKADRGLSEDYMKAFRRGLAKKYPKGFGNLIAEKPNK